LHISLLAKQGIGTSADSPGAGKRGIGTGCGIVVRTAISRVSLLIGKSPQLFDLVLRQIQRGGFHSAVGAIEERHALQPGNAQHGNADHQGGDKYFNQRKALLGFAGLHECPLKNLSKYRGCG
jgi:hypothetical protein